MIRMMGDMLVLSGKDWGGLVPWVCACPRLQACMFFN